MIRLPNFFRVRQHFDATRLDDVQGEVERQLARLELGSRIRPGQSVAVTVGSRGIANLATIIQAAVEHLRRLGGEPFLVPAMGSHGGATAEGQRRLIESYGVTETAVGCPIRSGMETVVVCRTTEGTPVHFDRHAFEADHVLVCNRVKPHTMFAGPIESGLIKMMLIGLGNREGAGVYHRAIQQYSFAQIIRSAASEVLTRCRIVAGLAIVENAFDETARIEAIRPDEFESREPELLLLARRLMPRLPFDDVDLLLVDRIGKDISGTGMDTNIIGRKFNDHGATGDETPRVRRIAVRGLSTPGGNALGIGMAEFCRSRILREADWHATRTNVLTSGHIGAAMPPLDYETDREMIETALSTVGLVEPTDARVLWIRDTLHLAEVECSTAYLAEARHRDNLEVLAEPRRLPLDEVGNLLD
ncbi:MAG TPA: [Fe-S]-binding protein [Planctomycetaceae bacterium]|nr:[Fe-S]-binding protein [Planctomycetaceae bacterium]